MDKNSLFRGQKLKTLPLDAKVVPIDSSFLLTSAVTLCHRRPCSETSVTRGSILGYPLDPAHPAFNSLSFDIWTVCIGSLVKREFKCASAREPRNVSVQVLIVGTRARHVHARTRRLALFVLITA